MNSAPCVRFAMRISPKMSEKPAASRNSRPPRARLFSVCMIQYCTRNGAGCPGPVLLPCLRLEILRGRPVARVHRILQELLRLVGPELAHVRVGVDHPVHEAPVLALDLADIDVADHVAVLVKAHRAAAGVDLDRAHRLHERLLVLDIALDPLQRRVEHRRLGVGRRGVEARVVLPILRKASTNFWLIGLSISAEYQHEVTMPSASSPMLRSTASSSAVMPPIGFNFLIRPYSFSWRR